MTGIARSGAGPGLSPVEDDARLELPTDLRAAGIARWYVRDLLRDLVGVAPDTVDLAELLTSELVANAVLHGHAPVVLRLRRRLEALRVEVRDAGAAFEPTLQGQWSLTEEGGRGLALVATLASSWGSSAHEVPRGKTVWFELNGATAGASGV